MIVEYGEGRRFDAAVPILIAGGGAAGLTAALAASAAGAECYVIEKSHECLGSSSMSLGALAAANTTEQRRHGVDDSAEAFLNDIMRKTMGRADPVVSRVVAEQSGPTLDWLSETQSILFGLDTEWRPAFGHTVQRMHSVSERTGSAMMSKFRGAVERAGVGVLTDAAVSAAFCDEDKRICGARITRPDGSAEEIGCEVLVLATCGFGGNAEMIRRYIPTMANALYFGWEGNCGDGILLGESLDAELGDMSSYQGLGLLANAYGIDVNPKLLIQGGIQVNAQGRRFSNELEDVSGQAAVVIAQTGSFSWVVYDERIRAACSALPQLRELQSLGGEKRGDTLELLASVLNLPESNLQETIEAWNQVRHGDASDAFGRDGCGTLLAAPYFAVRVTGALFHTQGGLAVDENARVRQKNGDLLPNLFAAGGTARGMSGSGASGYLPGAGLAAAITLGRVAGESAAKQVRGRKH